MLRETRVLMGAKAWYCFKKSEYECDLLDFSRHGIKIHTNQILEEGDLLKIDIKLERDRVTLFGIIRNKNLLDCSYGLEIEEMHEADREMIDKFMRRELNRHKLSGFEQYRSMPTV